MKASFGKIAAMSAVLGALAMAPATAPACMGEPGPPRPGQQLKKMAKELNLTPQQKERIKAIFEKNRPAAEPLLNGLRTERKTLHDLIQADTVDEAAIRAQAAKVAAIGADLAVQRAHTHQEIRDVLTPEQIAKAKELKAQRERRKDDRRKRQGKPMPPEE